MRKWILSFLILLLVLPAIPVSAHYMIIGGGDGSTWSPFTITKTVSAEGIETKPSCTLGTANWWSCVSLCSTNLRILCDSEYTRNNASISLSTSSVYFNVIFYLKCKASPYGEVAIAYGTYIDTDAEGNCGLHRCDFGHYVYRLHNY
jgi:hypothetical protein